jgi:hypothetical protein
MAEARDAKGKPDKEKSDRPADPTTEILFILIIVVLVSRLLGLWGGESIFNKIGDYFSSGSFDRSLGRTGGVPIFQTIISLFYVISNVLSAFFIVAIIYSGVNIVRIDTEWRKQLYPEPPGPEPETPRNSRWDMVTAHIGSDNPSEWRLAILEADIILDELLDRLGYVGDTIGDKLKNANVQKFRTLDNAWEAHKIRNAIAHEGSDFVLTQREARRIVTLYETVFREFDYI